MPGGARYFSLAACARRWPLILSIALLAGAAPLHAGPGDPFGGDDAGCVPPTTQRLTCSLAAVRAFDRFESAVVSCHRRQASARYTEVILGQPAVFDEHGCEVSAAARFDARLAIAACNASPVLAAAAANRAALNAALEAQNGSVYCDATSGTAIDPGGDDAGFIPATHGTRTCAQRVAANLRRLTTRTWKCHRRAANAGFSGSTPPFDEEACEATALGHYDTTSARLAAGGVCPPCLNAAAQSAARDAVLARLESSNANAFPCPDPVLHAGTAQLDRPTLVTLGVQWLISGDENHDAAVAVRYRVVGAPTWIDALPLMRVHPENVPGRTVPEQFAGSIFDVRPATSYEIELHATDADGSVDETRILAATTRAVPGDPASPTVVPVATVAELNTALAAAQSGDVIALSDGVYVGPFELSAGGTATNPIVIRGATRDGTILDGGGCTDCNVLEVYGSFVHVERLTLRNANRALRFQTAAAEGNVVRRVRTQNTRLGLGSREDQLDFYLCDNLLEGRLLWPHVYTDDDGAFSDDDGIHVEGHGHVVCHNQLVGFGDALKNAQAGARALDFYGNEVLSAYDNGIELDEGEGNLRCLRNRFTNTYATISFQPVFGGPAYAVRNVVVNVAHEQMKFHGIGGATGPSGVLVYHNTFVSPATALLLETSVASHHFDLANNLFIGPATPPDKVVDWLGPIDDGRFDYDGYFPDGIFRFNLPPAGLVSYTDFAAMQAGGMEIHGVLLTPPTFASGLTPPPDYTTTLAPADVTLAAASNALDAGQVLPNVTDGFQGGAPDLGALERGCALPIFGIRPDGVDESNQSFGCGP